MTRDLSRPAPTSSADPDAPVPWWGKASDRWLLFGVLVLVILAYPWSVIGGMGQDVCSSSEGFGCSAEGGLLLMAPILVAPVVVVGLLVVGVCARWLRLVVIRRSVAALFTVQFLAFVFSFATGTLLW